MSRQGQPSIWLLGLGLLASCALDSHRQEGDERVAVTRAALDAPGLAPVPKGWPGNSVDLMFADAMVQCSYVNATDLSPYNLTFNDVYSQMVQGFMDTATCLPHNETDRLARWKAQREDTLCNVDPSTNVDAKVSLVPPATLRQQPLIPCVSPFQDVPFNGFFACENANSTVRAAVTNFCVAQRLRNIAPGAAGGAALLLPGEQQRQLLNVVRTQSQIAMLQYASIGRAIASPPLHDVPLTVDDVYGPTAIIPVLQTWATNPDAAQYLTDLGNDFAAAVQLQIATTSDLAELLSRSASAQTPIGPSASSIAIGTATLPIPGNKTMGDGEWGAGAWRQRVMALLYGGEPLSTDPEKYLWSIAGTTADPTDNPSRRGGWPPADAAPYVTEPTLDPQVDQFQQLVQRYDVLDLIRVGDFNAWVNTHTIPVQLCDTYDVEATATRMYRAIEARLRTADCEMRDMNGACATVTLDQVEQPMGDLYTKFLLWTKLGINPDHAHAFVRRFVQVAPLKCMTQSGPALFSDANYVAPSNYVPRAFDLDGAIAEPMSMCSGAPCTHFDKGIQFVEKTLEQLAPLYGSSVFLNVADHLEPSAEASNQGFPATRSPFAFGA
ncbi:MAG TPA: hypothetical protein VGY54_17855, partial [Polyangiaceae bacterium]|nr:hypothetical protein [Polyangiaceae bacterium]